MTPEPWKWVAEAPLNVADDWRCLVKPPEPRNRVAEARLNVADDSRYLVKPPEPRNRAAEARLNVAGDWRYLVKPPEPRKQVATMRLGHARRNRRPALTPLVDVVFILLIFFMLETRFLREGAVGWSVSAGGGGVETAPLNLVLFDEQWLWIGDDRIAVPTAAGLDGFCGRVTALAGTGSAVLRPAPAVRLQHLVDLSGALRGCGLRRVAIHPLIHE